VSRQLSLKFSIITCTLNSIKCLDQSIRSVLAQDYPDIEYIFIDGGSDDGTIDLINKIDRPIVLVNDIGGGISTAMNKGIECATGDVIAHLHSDDYFYHDKVISRASAILKETGAEWCFGRALNDIGGKISPEPWKVPIYSYKRILQGNFIPHVSTFVRKRIFTRLGMYNTSYRYAMDYDMWLRIGKAYSPAQVDEHWGVFRRHPGSISTANELDGFREDFRIRMAHIDKTPWNYANNYVRFLFRQYRLKRHLKKGNKVIS
jgi:glycosyltransferase involved in cell wall biosynthesis